MDFSTLDNTQLIMLHESLKELHADGAERLFFLGDSTRTINASNAIMLNDPRLTALLGDLRDETHNELCQRFSTPIAKATK